MSDKEKKAQAAAQVDMEKEVEAPDAVAIAAAMKVLGISPDEMNDVQETQAKKLFEAKKGQIETSSEIAALVAEVKKFGSPIRIVIESSGKPDVEPTRRITFPKSVSAMSSGSTNGTRGSKCKVDGVEYDTMAKACDHFSLAHEGISARVVLNRAKRNGDITSFELV